jgi:exopolysaccharide biosynthesis predicted pyruvyltransferase EpsI
MTSPVHQLRARIDAELLPIIGGAPRRIVLLDAPDHPNVGDQAILLGELAFLRRHFPDARLHVASYTTYRAGLDDLVRSADVVVLHGGGNFGDIWPQHHEFRLRMLETYRDRRLIQFPQSISFSDPATLERTKAAIAGCADFHLLARDRQGLAFAEAHFDCPVSLCPDMAFCLGPLEPRRASLDVFCLFRTDKEVLEPKADAVARRLDEARLTYEIGDWLDDTSTARYLHGLLRRVSRRRLAPHTVARHGAFAFEVYARSRLKHGIALLSRGELVLTDRLHGFILSTLLGRRRVVWDSLDGKIGAFHSTWLGDDRGVRFLHRVEELRTVIAPGPVTHRRAAQRAEVSGGVA